MKYIFRSFFLIAIGLSCTAKAQEVGRTTRDTSLQLLSYGLQRPWHQNARTLVAEKYGFSYKTIAGCVVTKELVDSANRRNIAVRKKLEQRYGPDFWSRFENEVKAEMLRQESAKSPER